MSECKHKWEPIEVDSNINVCHFCGKDQLEFIRDLKQENTLLKSKLDKAITCLQKMADEDYRGNRNPLSVDAFHCLKELSKGEKEK